MNPFVPPKDPDTLRIIPFGGCGEFGMNLTNYLYDGKLFVVDCGVLFPDQAKLGVGSIIPDVRPFYRECGGVYAYIITHGHEDHIGALPYIYEEFPAAIYATPWTIALIRRKFEKTYRFLDPKHIHTLEAGDSAKAERISFEYVHVNHSIPQACSLMIRTAKHKIFHTGDFKCDPNPIIEKPFSESYLKKLGGEGIDLLLSDSTNATKEGHCPGESEVEAPLMKVLNEAKGAVVVTTFSSNLWRLVTFISCAQKAGRKVLVRGRSIQNTLDIAAETGVYTPPANVIVEEVGSGYAKRQDLLVIATGCQGEWRAAMSRMAKGESKDFKLQADDTVVFSSRVIPGNEKHIIHLTNLLLRIGVHVITPREAPGIHVSGHAYRGDLDLYLRALKPKNHVPVHGSIAHQHANLNLVEGQDFHPSAHHLTNGDIWEIKDSVITSMGSLDVELRYVDQDSNAVLSKSQLKERLKIGEQGLAVLTGVFSAKKRQFISGPEIDLQGVGMPFLKEEGPLLSEAAGKIANEFTSVFKKKSQDRDVLLEQSRILLRRHLGQMLNKKPVVLSRIHIV